MNIPYLTEFGKTLRFWYPRVARDSWIDFYSRTVDIRSSEYWENLSFCFSLSLISLSLSDFSFSCLLSVSFFLLFFFYFFPYPPTLPCLVYSILISFHLFSFSLFSSFLLLLHVWIKWGKLPLTLLLGHLSSSCFSSLFPLFYFSLLLHYVTHGSI